MRRFPRVVILCLCTALVSCARRDGSTTQLPPAGRLDGTKAQTAFVAGHLYVSVAMPSGQAPVERYPLANGVPAAHPDLIYPGNLLPWFAVDVDGSLYGVQIVHRVPLENFVAFAPNSTKVVRRIIPPEPYDSGYTSVAVRAGYIYSSFFYASALRGRAAQGSVFFPCSSYGVVVFGPQAHGHASPITCFSTTPLSGGPNWMTLDSVGDLYVPISPAAVAVYANPATSPTLVRTLTGSSFQSTASLADDGTQNLYVLGTATPTHGSAHSYVASYLDTSNGNVKPLRVVRYPGHQVWNGNIAVDDRFLYVGGNQQVLVYDKFANGALFPIATLAVPGPSYFGPTIAVGP